MEWLFLLIMLSAGMILLVRPDLLRMPNGFRGSTLLGFLFLALGMTSPHILQPDQIMLDSGAGEDAFIGTWNLWWTREAILGSQNPFFTKELFHPDGTSLALHTYSFVYGLVTLPLQSTFAASGGSDLFGIYNLVVVLSFAFNGYLVYRLAWSVSEHRFGSVVAGVLFAFSNYRFSNTVRLHVLATEFLVLFLWSWITLLRAPRPRQLIAVALAGLALLYSSLEYSASAVLLLGWFTAAHVFSGRKLPRIARRSRKRTEQGPPAGRFKDLLTDPEPKQSPGTFAWIGAGLTATAIAAAGLYPFLIQLRSRLSLGATEFDPRLAAYFSADIFDFVLPNPRHPLFGGIFEGVTAGFHLGDAGFGMSLSLVGLALFTVFARSGFQTKDGRRWGLGALFFFLLTLGPELHFAGNAYSIPLPQDLIEKIPLIGSSRTPIRYAAPALLCFVVAIAVGWAAIDVKRRRATIEREGGLIEAPVQNSSRVQIALLSAILFELLAAPMRMTPVSIPGIYEEVRVRAAKRESQATLVHLPGMMSRENLFYQTVHQQRLLEDLGTAIPLHGGTLEPYGDPAWTALALQFARPGLLEGASETQRLRAITTIREFFRKYEVRFVVVPSSPQIQATMSNGAIPGPLLGSQAYDGYRENLRKLEPVSETEEDGFTLFEF